MIQTMILFIIHLFILTSQNQHEYGLHDRINTALGGVAQDGMMIVLVIFCASYLPNLFCTSMLYEGKRGEGIILLGIFLLITALDPVKFCLENNRNHLIRQRKVVKNKEMMGEWKIFRHEIMIQSRQTCIAMFPYILIIIFSLKNF